MENPKAMSPQEAIAYFEQKFIDDYEVGEVGDSFFDTERAIMRDYLRYSMRSLLYWVAEQMPEREILAQGDGSLPAVLFHARNVAISDCRAVILAEANKLT